MTGLLIRRKASELRRLRLYVRKRLLRRVSARDSRSRGNEREKVTINTHR